MRVLIPTVDYPPIEGGIGTVTLEVSRELARAGHDVTVVAPWFAGMADFDREEPAHVLRYRGYHSAWLRFFPLLAKSQYHVEASDLIVAPNVAYGGVIGLRSGRPYITFAYAYEFLKFKHNPIFGGLIRRVYRKADLVVAISRFTAERLEAFGVPAEKIATVLPGASPHRIEPMGDAAARCRNLGVTSSKFILAVGRLIERKGQRTLVEAMPRILAEHPEVQLVLVGRGPCESALRTLAESTGVAERVIFTGRLDDDDLAALYQQCTLFALPTGEAPGGQVEGFGLVFTEAHAYGKPVVAGRSGGVVDAVRDGETGILVEPGEVDGVADAIIRLLSNSDDAQRMGGTGRKRVVDELNWTTFTKTMIDAWEARR